MLEVPKQRVLTFLSALPELERNGTVINLAASLARKGKHTLMVDAKTSESSLSAWLNVKADQTLLDVARQKRTMEFVIKEVSPGLSVTKVSHVTPRNLNLPQSGYRELSKVFDIAASRSDVVVVDCELNDDDGFLLSSFVDSDVIIQLSSDPVTIKTAYGLIKRMQNSVGIRDFGIVVTNVNQPQAELIFANLSMTAKRYLGVDLDLVGFIPDDMYLKRATESGRSVVEAFPLSKASNAFVRIADKLISTATSSLRFNSAPMVGAQLEY
jgi:flagellar biosynthesis protein FlhG